MKSQLGDPLAPLQSSLASGSTDNGYRLYSRQCQGGIVYVNFTGSTKTIVLPSGRLYYNAAGQQITSITLSDLGGDYVLYSPAARAAKPAINPRFSTLAQSPVTIAMNSDDSGEVVHYTRDGSTATAASPAYSSPITISATTTISAMATVSGKANSYPTTKVLYAINANGLSAQFIYGSASGASGLYYPVVKLSAAPPAAVSVQYQIHSGTSTQSGTLSFARGELYKHLAISAPAGVTVTVTLTTASGAIIGTTSTFRYTAM
jgi:hypothetical protein